MKPHTLADISGELSDKVGGATQHPAHMKSGTRVQRNAKRQLIKKYTRSHGIRPCSCSLTQETHGSKLSPRAAHRTPQDRDPARSGLEKPQNKQDIAKSSPMGLGKVAAALEGPAITPESMVEWRRAAAAPRRRPTMNKSARKICLGDAFCKPACQKPQVTGTTQLPTSSSCDPPPM